MDRESLNRFSNMVEARRNEIDKELIRKEITEEVARKCMLELEVKRELMMERGVAMYGGDRFASFLKNQAKPMLLEENMGMGVSAVSRHDKDKISEVPFRYRAVEPNISTLNQSPKAEILQVQPPGLSEILPAKPDTIFSGAKRKAVTLEVADKPSLNSAPVKNVTVWRCALCQICTPTQYDLNNHFQGKKHKRKETAFREQKDDKNCRIGLLPPSLLIDDSADDLRNNAAHEKKENREFTFWCDTCKMGTFSEKDMEAHKIGKKHKRKANDKNYSIGFSPKKPKFIQFVESPSDDVISGKKSGEDSSGTNDNYPPSLLIDDSANDLRKNTTHLKQNNEEFKFWCHTCKIGTFSEKVMEGHKIGKKHARHLQQLIGKDKQYQ